MGNIKIRFKNVFFFLSHKHRQNMSVLGSTITQLPSTLLFYHPENWILHCLLVEDTSSTSSFHAFFLASKKEKQSRAYPFFPLRMMLKQVHQPLSLYILSGPGHSPMATVASVAARKSYVGPAAKSPDEIFVTEEERKNGH